MNPIVNSTGKPGVELLVTRSIEKQYILPSSLPTYTNPLAIAGEEKTYHFVRNDHISLPCDASKQYNLPSLLPI